MPTLPYLRPRDLQWLFRISDKTVQKWSPQIGPFQVGHVKRYDPARVLEFIGIHTAQRRRRGLPVPEAEVVAQVRRLLELAMRKEK